MMNSSLASCFASAEFIPAQRIERRASECLWANVRRTGDEVAFPIPVEDIIELTYGLSPVYKPSEFFGEPEAGAVLGAFCFRCNSIYVNADEAGYLPRLRWTLAHELGHFILHRGMTGQLGLFGDDGDPILQRLHEESRSTDRLEIQANMFASYLLLPTSPIQELMRVHNFEASSSHLDQAATILSRTAMVSRQAASFRLTKLWLG